MKKPNKIRAGEYRYRDHRIKKYDGRGFSCWRFVWEITDKNGGLVNYWPTLGMCVTDIDEYLDKHVPAQAI